MFKRVLREIKHSNRKNPTKVVLIALLLLVSFNLILSGIMLNVGLSKNVKKLEEYSIRKVNLIYNNLSVVPEREITLEGFPIIYAKDFPKFLMDDFSGSTTIIGDTLRTLPPDDEGFSEERYLKGIASLGLKRDADHREMRSKFGNKFLAWEITNNYNWGREKNQEIKIEEGRDFIEGEDMKIIIPVSLSKEHDLSLGDFIEFSNYKKYLPFEIIGVYSSTDKGLSDDIILAQGGEVDIESLKPFSYTGYEIYGNVSMYLDSNDIENPIEYLEEWKTFVENIDDNFSLQNNVDKYSGVISQLKGIQVFTILGIVAVFIVTIYLIKSIIRRDIKSSKSDNYHSIYSEDKRVIKLSNFIQMIIISSLAIVITLFTAPAINRMFTTKSIASTVTFANDMDPLLDLKDYEELFVYTGNLETDYFYSEVPDIESVAKLSYETTMPIVLLFIVVSGSAAIIGLIVGNKYLDKKE